jgi:hypothetical protein
MMHAASPLATTPTAGPAAGSRAEFEAYDRDVAPFYDAELIGRDDLGFWRDMRPSIVEAGLP